MSVKLLSSLAFNSTLADAPDAEVGALSAAGVVAILLIFMSMVVVHAAGEPLAPPREDAPTRLGPHITRRRPLTQGAH